MNTRFRGLTTLAAAAAVGSLAWIGAGNESAAQNAVPNADFNRFTPSLLRVDPETDTPAAKAISQQTKDRTKERASKQGQSREESFLRSGKMKLLRDEGSHWSEEYPDHERDIEIEESRYEGWKMTASGERCPVHLNGSFGCISQGLAVRDFSMRTAHCLKFGSREMGSNALWVIWLALVSAK